MRHLVRRLSRPFWFALAAIFLFEAWAWDELGAFLKWVAALVPFESFKRALVRGLNTLPPLVVLLVFLIPVAVIEPFKIVGLWLIGHHHIVYGVGAFVAAKFLGLGVAAFLFDATRDKLLSMAWFARFYAWVMMVRARAHQILEPFKQRIRQALAPIKQTLSRMRAAFASRGALGRKFAFLKERARRLRGLT